MKYIFTPERYGQLVKLIEETNRRCDHAIKSGFDSGTEQDGHHDEGYQLSLRETAIYNRRINELEDVRRNAKIVVPIEQDETVQLGTGVIISYADGSFFNFVIEGYVLGNSEGQIVSMDSPLGKAILGAKANENREFSVEKRMIKIRVEKIFPPSKAKDAFTEKLM